MQLENKTVLITGASMGIGRATAICCAEAGARCVLADVDGPALNQTANDLRDLGGQALSRVMDVADASQVEDLVTRTVQVFGSIDVLIHSAGVLEGAFVPIDEFEEEVWDRVIDTNLKGSFLISKYVSSVMKKQKSGVMLLLSSGAGVQGGSSSIAYGSSKGGVRGLSLVLDGQLSQFGIRVHAVCPGGIATPLKLRNIADGAKASGQPVDEALEKAKKTLGDPEGVGELLVYLASDHARHVRQTVFTR